MELHINGRVLRIEVASNRTLLSVLRDDLDLTGSKYGCGEGECGSCTVLVDGQPVRSCNIDIGTLGNRKITTIEGLALEGELHPLQQAFIDHGAMQCGYCTPGMIMCAAGLLRMNSDPNPASIRRHMNGNICRCGTYPRIQAAIHQAAKQMKGSKQ